MTSFLKGFRSNGENAELRELADRINGERETLEGLITRAEGSSRLLGKITAPLPKLSERIAVLERQLSTIEGRVSGLAAVQTKAEELGAAQRGIEKELRETRDDVARVTTELAEVRRLGSVAATLKRDLLEMCELEGPFAALRRDADALKAGIAELAEGYRTLRDGREELVNAAADAASRVATVEQSSQAAMRDVERYARRVEDFEQRLADLAEVAARASDTKHQLLTLKSLADQVMQKAAALENQRDAVERAAKDVSRLDALVHQVDGAIREQEEQIAKLHSMAADVEDLASLYESVVTRSKTITLQQQQIEERERAARHKLAELGVQLGEASERFEVEHRGLETVSHQVMDLRAAVKDCEEHIAKLDVASRTVNEVEVKADKAWVRLGFFMGELEKLNELPERMRVIRNDAARLNDLMHEVSGRSKDIEKAKPAVEAAAADLASLARSHEAIKEALEQMSLAQQEMTRVRETQVGTAAWLDTVRESVADLQGRVKLIDAAQPTIVSVGRDVQRVLQDTETVASHRQFLADVQARLGELSSLAALLDERTKAFRSRLDVTEGRFVSVARRADETEQIASLVSKLSRTVTEADERVAQLVQTVGSLESRTQGLEGIPERVRVLRVELEQRQVALDAASEQLERTATLREDAAEAVQRLDERLRSLHAMLADLETRGKRIEAVSAELDEHAGRLVTVQRGFVEFESHLGTWETAEADLRHSLDQLESRRSTVDVLRANVTQMFELAERTADDLRAAVTAQREIRESRAVLDDLLERLHAADEASAALDLHREEIDKAEARLARAQALLFDIQSSLETLNNQKAMLDHVIEQAGALTFQIQQAEVLIDRLRKERDITNAVRTSLEDAGVRAPRAKREA